MLYVTIRKSLMYRLTGTPLLISYPVMLIPTTPVDVVIAGMQHWEPIPTSTTLGNNRVAKWLRVCIKKNTLVPGIYHIRAKPNNIREVENLRLTLQNPHYLFELSVIEREDT